MHDFIEWERTSAMPNVLHIFNDMHLASKLTLLLFITLVNCSLLYLAVSFILRSSKTSHARFKHFTWIIVICIFLIIPLISLLIPSPNLLSVKYSNEEILSLKKENSKPEQKTIAFSSSQILQIMEDYAYTPSHIRASAATVQNQMAIIHWQNLVICVWGAGIMLLLIHILVGRFGLHVMTKEATPENSYTALLCDLCRRIGIKSDVQIYKSSQCITPFTCFLFKPVIFLPANIHLWSKDRVRAVLLHELAHIKRRDHITRFIARVVCSLLWFVPPVWIAYNNIQIEEEKACDASVIETGVSASDYARHIVDITRSTKGKVLSLMPQHSFSKRRTLEPRIRNILRLRKAAKHVSLSVYIRIPVFCIACLLVLHVVNPLSAHDNSRLFKKEAPVEMIYGHWINEKDYNKWKADRPGQYAGKVIVRKDGSIQHLQTPECPELPYVGCNGYYTVEDSFFDRQGNYLYKIAFGECPIVVTYIIYELWRIDPTGTKMEITWDLSDYPSDIDPNRYEYYTFYRKQ